MVGRSPRTLRNARVIKVSSPYEDEPLQEVYTRFSRQQYERRRETFADWYPHRSYDRETEWGAQGGRPRKWANDAERKRAQRVQAKLAQGQPLTRQEKELLGLIKKRPGAYQSELGRAMTPAERQRIRRAKLKGGKAW